ncbi:MAG: ABC transporter ATP-binding protein [Chloroflexi bacterium]|nr:ABC transporter ATP-binding protein [Chloroflexota bacterium]MBK6708811.1 ABC transporter ATP-binding protein [Chloroflexota bacterium]MBK7179240.1 ABC transporter ATP-binding protein [Chloroflexota bacterium]MBK7917167.1 ABC transporter ATP-binding protein [Chloroflexota bacterium]MBK8934388.1 ABC transporter ATP-binding protein [Chloroflexota bacterium]
MIEISNVTKKYLNLTALDHVTLRIPTGEVIGLLGPNGAGKTTLFKLIAGISSPSGGKIKPANGVWPQIGYKPERLLFPNHLRVHEYLAQVAKLSNLSGSQARHAVDASLAKVNLQSAANKRIKECSKGMRQRLGLAQILIGDPPLLLLDEPSNGLDPSGQSEIYEVIHSLHEAGKTIVMSTHHLPEVTQVCTHLVILNRGQVHYENSMAQAMAAQSHIRIRAHKPLEEFGASLLALHDEIEVKDELIVLKGEAMFMRRQVLVMLLEAGYDVVRVEHNRVSLSEIYAEAVQ